MKESWWVSQPSSIHCSRVQYSWCQNFAEIWKALLKVTQLQKAVLSFSFVSFAGFVFFFLGGGRHLARITLSAVWDQAGYLFLLNVIWGIKWSLLLNQPEKFDPVPLGWNDFRPLCLRLQCRPIKAHNMSGVKLDERGLMVLCSLNSSKLLKSPFQIVLVLHDVPARAFLYKVFGKGVDFIVLLHQRFYSLPSRVDFLESRHARCLDWFSGLSLALSNLCDLLLCCLRNFAFIELGIVSQLGNCVVKYCDLLLCCLQNFAFSELGIGLQLGNCVVKVSNRFLEIFFPCSAHYSIRYDVYFLVVRCFVEQINVMVFMIRHTAKTIYSSLTLWPLRVTNIWFLLTISPLIYTLRSREYKKWSPTREAFDYQAYSPCQHLRKCIKNSKENIQTDVRV